MIEQGTNGIQMLLGGWKSREVSQMIELSGQLAGRGIVWLKEGRIARDCESALPRLGIRQGRSEFAGEAGDFREVQAVAGGIPDLAIGPEAGP